MAERPEKVRDTVRGARIIKSPVKLSPLRRQWKLRLVVSETDSSGSETRCTHATKQYCSNRLQHWFKNSESS
ncbi:MAG: hypothetical protein DMF31_09630 [Verrucomicrobia bacterium]|nr:MAG: hypothetical protein DMF31_09630 [Verrucomicrobiota bacterium]